jgi:hypothetical protein
MDETLWIIIFTTIILFFVHKKLQRDKFKPPAVIIGHRKYYDTIGRMYVDVVDYDGITVYFRLEIESEIADVQTLPEKEFLKRYKKVGRPDISIVRDDFVE